MFKEFVSIISQMVAAGVSELVSEEEEPSEAELGPVCTPVSP